MVGWRYYLHSVSLFGLLTSAFAADTTSWKPRSVYQVFTDRFARTDGSTDAPCNTTEGLYCGGTWRGVIDHLDYIQGMGFDAVMISPVTKNIEGETKYGEAYHGYWQQDLYTLNEHFGTRQDLLDLSSALHERGMFLMVDSVINNMAYITNGSNPATSVDYSVFTPFDSNEYFHPYCPITNYNDYPLAQKCWTGDNIVPLPDLKTEDSTVQKILEDWAKELIANYSVDGLRIDAAKHVTPSFLPKFYDAAGLYVTGEVYEQKSSIICNYQKEYLPSVPNYPLYYAMNEAFTAGNTTALSNEISVMKEMCPDVTALASFSENHDVPRFASYTKDMALAKNVLAFTILADGIPMIYQGQEQHFDGDSENGHNREALWLSKYDTSAPLYKLIATLNAIRRHSIRIDPTYIDSKSYPIYTGSSEVVVRKGQRQTIMVLSTQGEKSGDYNLSLPVTYELGTVAMDVLNCVNYTVDSSTGNLVVPMSKGEPRVLFPLDQMDGSGLCGFRNWSADGKGGYGAYYSAASGDGIYSRGLSTLSLALFMSAIGSAVGFMV
ncbi:hypothetical protein VTN00DRAFT_594 [Thermoascus crustaceus]|uniref:uncharacterized protein n=1 Tax=Thermoascus crustaceus TaxID=5088 RepID=UPI0037441898